MGGNFFTKCVIAISEPMNYSGLTSRLGLQLGGGAAGSISRSAFVFCGGENVCVHNLCMGVGVHTALQTFTQLSSVTEGYKLCWRTGPKLTLKPSFLSSFHRPIYGSDIDHPDNI